MIIKPDDLKHTIMCPICRKLYNMNIKHKCEPEIIKPDNKKIKK